MESNAACWALYLEGDSLTKPCRRMESWPESIDKGLVCRVRLGHVAIALTSLVGRVHRDDPRPTAPPEPLDQRKTGTRACPLHYSPYCSSLALPVISALNSFDTGHPVSAAFTAASNFALSA